MESYYPGFETPPEETADKTGVFDGVRYEERYGMPWLNALGTAGVMAFLPIAASYGILWLLLAAILSFAAMAVLARIDPLNYRWWEDKGSYPRTTQSTSGVFLVFIPSLVLVLTMTSSGGGWFASLVFGGIIFALSLYYFRKLIPWRYPLKGEEHHA